MTCLRLVLGDQLDLNHFWFRQPDAEVVFVMMEVRQETDHTWHHAQKIIAIFASMRRFAEQLRERGHRVDYLPIDAPGNRQLLPENLDELTQQHQATRLEYQEPDEYRLDRQLDAYARRARIPVLRVPSEHFYAGRLEVRDLFGARRHWFLDSFYRRQRLKHGVLVDDQGRLLDARDSARRVKDKSARNASTTSALDLRPTHDHRKIWQAIQAAGVRALADPQAECFRWALDRHEALIQLDHFIEHALPQFGSDHGATHLRPMHLLHAQIAYALNTKMLNPREVVAHAVAAYDAGHAPLEAVDGFVRQILGWREYARGVYWARMPNYSLHNFFGHRRRMPAWFWTGNTRMRCLAACIGESLQHAHALHTWRLTVIGNFALLAGIDPLHVQLWNLGIYVDAAEWIEMPNVLGLSQFADGGLLAKKPSIFLASKIDRVGNHCRDCQYSKTQRSGALACPFNTLYWAFLIRHRQKLVGLPRMRLAYKSLALLSPEQISAVGKRAEALLNDIEQI